jgi:predicted DNA-binding transcriptional regulator AlpA
MNDRVLYSITEARELLGKMSRNMIYDLLRSGELPRRAALRSWEARYE